MLRSRIAHNHLFASLCLLVSAWVVDGDALAARYMRGMVRVGRTCPYRSAADSHGVEHRSIQTALTASIAPPGSDETPTPESSGGTLVLAPPGYGLAALAPAGQLETVESLVPLSTRAAPAAVRGPPQLFS